jgi:hypothetical protein
MSNQELAQLRSLRVATLAVVAQIDARIQILTGSVPEAGESCPKCGGTDLTEAGDVSVCAQCNANVRDGELVA